MILSGKPVAQAIEQELKERIEGLKQKNIQPHLAVILVGDDPASILYVRKKEEKAESLGIGFKLYHFPAMAAESDILNLITDLNQNKNIHGVIVQLPLPDSIDSAKIIAAISAKKDVDGLIDDLKSVTAGAILEMLKYYNIDINNKKIVIIGRGKLVGVPLEKILKSENFNVEVCDSKTANLQEMTLSADIIISGVGKPGLIKSDMVSEKAIVIDAGTAEEGGSTVGDVDQSVYQKVSAYSPVPGGVGPITVIKLLKNVVESAEKYDQ